MVTSCSKLALVLRLNPSHPFACMPAWTLAVAGVLLVCSVMRLLVCTMSLPPRTNASYAAQADAKCKRPARGCDLLLTRVVKPRNASACTGMTETCDPLAFLDTLTLTGDLSSSSRSCQSLRWWVSRCWGARQIFSNHPSIPQFGWGHCLLHQTTMVVINMHYILIVKS